MVAAMVIIVSFSVFLLILQFFHYGFIIYCKLNYQPNIIYSL